MKDFLHIIILFHFSAPLLGQAWLGNGHCGAQAVHSQYIEKFKWYRALDNGFEERYVLASREGLSKASPIVYTIPVVVHIIHENGLENISDAQVIQGIADLNGAFRNTGYYDPATGVDVEIEFCLAQRDTAGGATTGIVRHLSPATDMSQPGNGSVQAFAWDTHDYINIRLVREACLYGDCANIAGYSTFPAGHGFIGDGIVMEAALFGISPEKSTTIVHEMGHYLGLLHTFTGGCLNNDCLLEGDRVCDTPPDNANTNFPCHLAINSCQTDTDDSSLNNPYRDIALGGLGDQDDHHRNYMDYGFKFCRDRFSQGQKERMRFFLESARQSLLTSKGCLPPCPLDPIAMFNLNMNTVEVGDEIFATNLSENANNFNWYINGTWVSGVVDPSFTFDEEGVFTILLEVESPLAECSSDFYQTIVTVACPVIAGYDYFINNNWLAFNDLSTNANSLAWTIKDGTGATLYTSNQPVDSFDVSNYQYLQLCLLAENGLCDDMLCEYINLTGGSVEVCNNGIDDDGDGMVDLFDQECPCSDSTYQAYCPIDCEYLPDSFPSFEMKVKWVSELVSNYSAVQNIVTGDIDSDGVVEIITKKSIGDLQANDIENNVIGFSGSDGSTVFDFNFASETSFYSTSILSMADIDLDGSAEFFSLSYNGNTILCHSSNGNLLWESETLMDYRGTLVNIADFNSDGVPELYIGNEILSSFNGNVLTSGDEGAGCNIYISTSTPCRNKHTIACDLLPSSGLELAAGNAVYQVIINNPTGSGGNIMTPVLAPNPVKDGFTSVGDINGDGELDVVVVRDNSYPDGGGIWVWDPRNTSIIASASAGEHGGVPFIGDVDGDCQPEIGMTFRYELRMYKYNGTQQLELLYSLPTTDESGLTGITMFDFNQDNKQELVYRDETSLRILDGASGNTLSTYPINSTTWLEYPIISDVDSDGEAEILSIGFQDGNEEDVHIYCFESAGAPWAPARSVWNQYGYHVTNVNDDLTIPRQPQNQSATLEGHENCAGPSCPAPYNNFMVQATYRTQEGCVQFPAADLSISILGYECIGDSLSVCLKIANSGNKNIGGTVGVTLYSDNPRVVNGQAVSTTSVIVPELTFSDTICIGIPVPSTGLDSLFVTVNDLGLLASPFSFPVTDIIECNYANNIAVIMVGLEPSTLDLGRDIVKCESEVVTLVAGDSYVSYLWSDGSNSPVYSSSFAGLHFIEVADQCGNIFRDTVEVTFEHSGDIDLGADVVACPGEEIAYSASGDYDLVQWFPPTSVSCDTCTDIIIVSDTSLLLIVVAGKGDCFSADTAEVTVIQKELVHENLSICNGDTLEFMGSQLDNAGQYEFSLNGCDSFLLLDLMLNPLDSLFLEENICAGDSLFFGGGWLKDNGSYYTTEIGTGGCDSLVFLDLSIVAAISKFDTLTLCEGDSLEVFGQWVYGGEQLEETFTGLSDCDSIQSYQVLVEARPTVPLELEVCEGDSVLVGSTWLSVAGYHEVIVPAQVGCDSVFEVQLTELLPVSNFDTLFLCKGDSLEVFGQWAHGGEMLEATFTGQSGCDSFQLYQVIDKPLPFVPLELGVCKGDSVLIGGIWLSDAGYHEVIVPAQVGCDTVLGVQLTELPPVSNFDTLYLCEGDSLEVFGQWAHGGEILEGVFTGQFGCDSVQMYWVIAEPLQLISLEIEACESDSVLVGNTWLSPPGTYNVVVPALVGCDTVYEVTLGSILATLNVDTLNLCEGDSVMIFGNFISSAGTYTETFTSSIGCDSTQVYMVSVASYGELSDTLTICQGDSLFIGGQWVHTPGIYLDTIDAWPCSSILSILVHLENPINTLEHISLCPGDSVLIDSEWVTSAGDVMVEGTAANGCDSTHTVIVEMPDTPDEPEAYVDCEALVNVASIYADGWDILWSNGDTAWQTAFSGQEMAMVELFYPPDCEIGFSLMLPQFPDTSIIPNLMDLSVKEGETIQFDLGLDGGQWEVKWSPSGIFSCDTCFYTLATPAGDVSINLILLHSSGCIYQKRFSIELLGGNIYIPNVFSPNGDGINDVWHVKPPDGVGSFERAMVFDRWGNQIALWEEASEIKWDGTFRGQPLNPAVFVYFIEFFDGKGNHVLKKGGLTILK